MTVTDDLLPAPAAVAAVEDAIRAFMKALRAQQLYLPNNSTRAQTVEQARSAFAAVWTHTTRLDLEVREGSFEWEGAVVYQDADRGSEGLPWLLHRDGVRTLALQPGFETDDLEALLSIVQKARAGAADEDDIVTMLWVANLGAVEYRYVEIGAEGAAGSGTWSGAASGGRDGSVVEDGSNLLAKSVPAGVIDPHDFDATLYFLEPREMDYLRDELDQEYAVDQRRRAFQILLDMLEIPEIGARASRVVELLDQLLLETLANADYEQVAFALREAGITLARAALPPDIADALRTLPARLSEPAVMAQLLQTVDEGMRTPSAQLLETLFGELRPSALLPLVTWLGSAPASPARAAIERASLTLAGANTGELSLLIEHSDAAVVRGAMRVAAQLAIGAAVPAIARILRGDDDKLRMDAVSTLADIGTAGALQALERAIEDADRDVRVAACRALAARHYTGALPRLAQVLRRKELRVADLGEKMAVFETYGTLCGDAGVADLDGVLNSKGMLGSKEPAELRACAARALALIGTPMAVEALQRAAADKDVIVRSAVTRALRGIT